jgi:hypothetical protein
MGLLGGVLRKIAEGCRALPRLQQQIDKLRPKLEVFASFRRGGFTEAADADLTDAQLRGRAAIGQRGSSRPTPNAHVSSSSLSPKSGVQSERLQRVCHNEQLTGCQNGEHTTG